MVDWRIVAFLLRFFGLVLVWFLLYQFLMKPSHIPDRWLTRGIAEVATVVINIVIPPEPRLGAVFFSSDQVAYLTQNGKSVFGIADLCNGLELMAIYAGLLILFPGSVSRKWKYLAAGLGMIFLANVVRAVALYYIYYHYYDYFLFNHKYVFTILMYVVIFIGWLFYTRKLTRANA